MRQTSSNLNRRVHSYAMTHDGNRLFGLIMGALIVAWTFTAIASTGGLCPERQAGLHAAPSSTVAGQASVAGSGSVQREG